MAIQYLSAILAAIRAGTSATKIIAKYGKKAYDAVIKTKAGATAQEKARDLTVKGATGVTGAFVASALIDKKIEAPSKKKLEK